MSDAVEDNRRVFHYTSGTGLIGIIRSRCLWATQIQYLNDEREYLLAFEWARSIPESISVVREGEARRYPEFTAAIEERLLPLAQHFQRGRKPAIFVSSFSTQEDDLSQWRSYGSVGDAYAIGFRCSELPSLRVTRDGGSLDASTIIPITISLFWTQCGPPTLNLKRCARKVRRRRSTRP